MGVPLLAVCRGFQEVNVAFGGSLYQKVHEQPGYLDHRENPDDPLEKQYAPVHAVTFNPDGLLAGIAGTPSERVNSLHGQGVARLGKGLKVEAVAPDGLVEAFRHEGAGFPAGRAMAPGMACHRKSLLPRHIQGLRRCLPRACRTTQRMKVST